MTVAELIEYLKTLPQDYEVKQETIDSEPQPDWFEVDHERKIVWMPGT